MNFNKEFGVSEVFALIALILSGVALIQSSQASKSASKFNKISVMPSLELGINTVEGLGPRGFFIKNNGMGIARITRVVMNAKGKAWEGITQSNWIQIARHLKANNIDSHTRQLTAPFDISPNTKEFILIIKNMPSDLNKEESFAKFTRNLDLYIEYESLYGEKLHVSSRGFVPAS